MKKKNNNNLALAPMDWITTCATRLLTQEIFKKYWTPTDDLLLRTEFMNVDGFLINPEKVIKHLQTTPDQQPIAQIYGGNETTLIEASRKIEHSYSDLFSWIELNLGCPSNTVMKCGGGSELMKTRKKTLTLIQHLSESLKTLPFSLKARTWLNDTDKQEQADFLLAASPYCSKISIHGRTLKQLYSGESDWEFIQQIAQTLHQSGSKCQIIGNGGITSYQQAQEYRERYNLEGSMIGQAAIGNPRIFTPHTPTMEEKLQTILRHLDLAVACDQLFNGEILLSPDQLNQQIQKNLQNPDFEHHALVEFRKFLFQYLKGIPASRERKPTILTVNNYKILREKIITFFDIRHCD